LAFAGYRYFSKKEEAPISANPQPLYLQAGNDAFTTRMNRVVQQYLVLKDAFVQGDTAGIANSGKALVTQIDSLALQQLQADSNLVNLATTLQAQASSACNNLLTAKGEEARLRSFQTCSDLIFDLLRTVQYKGAKLYQQYCPMAFDNTGANWLSVEKEIMNPYFGSKMLHCGEVKDSISFVP
jgi:Cu(I)/Ag(I) efflux system membrane fusion protein